MSDTVKLIVKISKDQYEICKQALKDFGDRPITECEFAIAVGIPLDSVKAEIEKKCDRINSIASVLRYPQHREIQELLCEILASIDKESEDKE